MTLAQAMFLEANGAWLLCRSRSLYHGFIKLGARFAISVDLDSIDSTLREARAAGFVRPTAYRMAGQLRIVVTADE